MATTKQIKMLRAGFAKTGMMNYWDDMLAGFEVQHAEDLTNEQVNTALNQLQQAGYEVKLRKHAAPEGERPGFATTKQLAKLKHLWLSHPKVREKTDAALLKFVQRLIHVDAFEWIERHQVQKLIKAIENL
ncbi:MAG: hypothetical protein AMXMBFR48_15210 [Ignavibacteriales bacterium]